MARTLRVAGRQKTKTLILMHRRLDHLLFAALSGAGSALKQEPLLAPLADEAAYGHGLELPAINPRNRCRPYR